MSHASFGLGKPSRFTVALQQVNSHAVLLHGEPGIGQFEFALGMARSWLCESSPMGAKGPACGQCISCKLIDAGSHPDLMVVLPEALQAPLGWQKGASGEGADEGEGAAEKSGKSKN